MTTETNQKTASAPTSARPSWFQRRILTGNRLHKWLIVLLAAGCAGLYGWHLWTTHEMRGQLDQEQTAMKNKIEGAIQVQMETSLRVTGLGLSWAATQAMQRDDLTGIDAHITRMVKEGPVTLIAVVDREGVVRVATNKKLEGQAASTALPGAPLAAAELTVVEQGAELLLVAPLEYGLGRVVLVYDWPDLMAEPALGAVKPATPTQATTPAPTQATTPAPTQAPTQTTTPAPTQATTPAPAPAPTLTPEPATTPEPAPATTPAPVP